MTIQLFARDVLLSRLRKARARPWDIAIIGGGAVGLGAALDAVTRGHSCVLLEQHDFGKGTSSRSTKLIHGGVRYLAQGNLSLVREALRERQRLLQNAPSLVQPLRFIIPCTNWAQRWSYWAGLKCYDALAGRSTLGRSGPLNRRELQVAIPGLKAQGWNGGVAYYDAQFDDARLLIAIARRCAIQGAVPLNYARVNKLLKRHGRIRGLQFIDQETGQVHELDARVVINATGVFSDQLRRLDDPSTPPLISPSQGIHLVVDQRFLGGEHALLIPKTDDGRVLFAIPWQQRLLLGTTDTPVASMPLEPEPQLDEFNYLLKHFSGYLDPAPTRSDVLSVFAGLRPLLAPQRGRGGKSTAQLSREHQTVTSETGLVSILGGKWTTYRKMAEDVVTEAERVGGLSTRRSRTARMRIDLDSPDADATDARCHPSGPTDEQVVTAVRNEFARTVEDVLSRRYRYLVHNAAASVQYARRTAELIAAQLDRSPEWIDQQVAQYQQLAKQYLPPDVEGGRRKDEG